MSHSVDNGLDMVVLYIVLSGYPTYHVLIFISGVMKILVYHTPFDNAEELVARIAVAAGEIRDMLGIF